MKVTLVIPTLNEAGCIERVLAEVPRDVVDEILIVDGHSTDGTADIVRKLGHTVIVQKGTGYGSAFTEGIAAASGDVVVLMDGDGSHNPADIGKLVEKIKEGYDYVLAVRYLPGSRSEDDTFVRHLGNMFFTFLVNLVHKVWVSDCLYLFTAVRKSVFDKITLESRGFEYCTEILIKVHKAGFKLAQIPSVERARYSGRSKVNAFYHGLKILWSIFKY